MPAILFEGAYDPPSPRLPPPSLTAAASLTYVCRLPHLRLQALLAFLEEPHTLPRSWVDRAVDRRHSKGSHSKYSHSKYSHSEYGHSKDSHSKDIHSKDSHSKDSHSK